VKIEDSNIANLGTELEKKVKLQAAENEPQWKGIGNAPGLNIWRIEKFQVVPVPKEEYGTFYSGDSYIVLHTYKKEGSDTLKWNAHMWVGLQTTMDEAGTAAYKIVELDDVFKREIVLFREVQGFESEQFLKYFQSIRVLEGGVDSGFKRVPSTEYKPRLLHVKGKSGVFRIREIPLKCSSLNSNDVFILDNGLVLYVWKGKTANSFEKFKAASICEEIKAERKSLPKVFTFDDGSSDGDDSSKEFWSLLGGKETIKAESDLKDDQIKGEKRYIYKLSDSTGKLELTEVPFAKSSLSSDDVFIIDNGAEIVAWIGSKTSNTEKTSALKVSEQYLKDYSRPVYLSICMMKEGLETAQFNQLF